MGTRILIVTVGGSCAPVVCAVRDHQPDFVYFICSSGPKPRGSSPLVDGPGDVCGDDRTCPHCHALLGNPKGQSIVAQAGLTPERYTKVETANPDDMQECFKAVTYAYEEALKRHPAAEIIADYTGGTKSMSAALMRAATGRYAARSHLSVVAGQRGDLRAVQDGTESAWIQETASFVMEEQWHAALDLANGYHYASADTLLTAIMRHPISADLRRKTQVLIAVCRGFDAWDRFDHAKALEMLRPQGRLAGPLLSTLDVLAHADAAPQAWDVTCVLPVYDLLLNAQRRATQGRYDDAVARLYRALELLAQNRLHSAYKINPGDVDPSRVPEIWLAQRGHNAAAAEIDEGADGASTQVVDGPSQTRIRIGLRDGYLLLAALGDAVGRAYQQHEPRLLVVLERRNQSILAHGMRPIDAREYPALRTPVEDFLRQAIDATGVRMKNLPAQFPPLTAAQFA